MDSSALSRLLFCVVLATAFLGRSSSGLAAQPGNTGTPPLLPSGHGPLASFSVEVDTSKAPECVAFAEESKALVEEWDAKIDEILFGKGHPLPTEKVRLSFEPMKGVASTSKNEIRVSAEWVTKKAPNDYGMVIHELTHVVQDYRSKGEFWVTEGIADYIRDKHFEPG